MRTAQQTEIGLFWTDNAAAQYSRAFRALIARQGLDTAASARLAAMYSVAASDAGTACMNAKYHFAFWRPYTAIHDADTDGNPDTVADPNWIPLAVTPGHPEYPRRSGPSRNMPCLEKQACSAARRRSDEAKAAGRS